MSPARGFLRFADVAFQLSSDLVLGMPRGPSRPTL